MVDCKLCHVFQLTCEKIHRKMHWCRMWSSIKWTDSIHQINLSLAWLCILRIYLKIHWKGFTFIIYIRRQLVAQRCMVVEFFDGTYILVYQYTVKLKLIHWKIFFTLSSMWCKWCFISSSNDNFCLCYFK